MILGTILCGLVLGFSPARSEPPPRAEGARAVDEAWLAAVRANDLDAVMDCYAADAVMWLPDAPEARGHNAIREAYAAFFEANTITEATFANAQYETSGGLSAGWGEFTLSLTVKSDGTLTALTGRFSVIAKRQGGKWVYVVDHASSHSAEEQE
jgi:ketosteroid isomerase-like protein